MAEGLNDYNLNDSEYLGPPRSGPNTSLDVLVDFNGADLGGPDALAELLSCLTDTSSTTRQLRLVSEEYIDLLDPDRGIATAFERFVGFEAVSQSVQSTVKEAPAVSRPDEQSGAALSSVNRGRYNAPDNFGAWRDWGSF